MAVNIKTLSEEKRKELINKCINGTSMRQLEKDYNITRQSISKYIKDNNITIKISGRRKYIHDFDYFENIDNEHKAYWLGFMFADGYIVDYSSTYGEDSFGVKLHQKDQEHLKKFKKDLKATNPILDTSEKTPSCRLLCTSQKTVNDLIDKGCIKQKSLLLEPPKKVPDKLLFHFIRGYFDGDGSLSFYTSKNDYKNYQIKILSTEEFCKWLLDIFQMGNIYYDKRTKATWVYEVGGNKQVANFCKMIYDNSTIYMDRKYNEYNEMLKYVERQGS